MPVKLLADGNAAQAIARVTSIPELFTQVVHAALDIYPPETPTHPQNTNPPLKCICTLGAAVVISHVCSAWRATCLDTPTVWARQIGLIPLATIEFLARSKDAQLDVHWDSRRLSAHWPEAARVESSQLRSLIWTGDSGNMTGGDFLRTTFAGNLSNLVSMELWKIKWNTLCPAKLIHLPHLLHLSLNDLYSAVRTVFSTPVLKKLKYHHCALPLTSLWNTLRSSPLLEELIISRCQVGDGMTAEGQQSSSTYRDALIELPCLQSIDVSSGYALGTGASALFELLASLRMQPAVFRVLLDGEWTEPLLNLCLRHTFMHDPPAYLLIDEQLQFYSHMDARPAPLPPKIDKEFICANIAYPYLPKVATMLPTLGMHGQLSNLTTLMMATCSAAYLNRNAVSTRSIMGALPNIETYWVLNSTFVEYWDEDSDVGYECLVLGLSPGATDHDRRQLPFPRLRAIGLAVTTGDASQLLDTVIEVLTRRSDEEMSTPGSLSLPFIPRPRDDDASARQLLSLIPVVHWGERPPMSGLATRPRRRALLAPGG